MLLNQFLLLGAFLFCTGIYGVLTRKHTVLVLMSIELMLAAVNINLVAFGAFHNTGPGRGPARCSRCSCSRSRPPRSASGSPSSCSSTATFRSADLDDVDVLKG